MKDFEFEHNHIAVNDTFVALCASLGLATEPMYDINFHPDADHKGLHSDDVFTQWPRFE